MLEAALSLLIFAAAVVLLATAVRILRVKGPLRFQLNASADGVTLDYDEAVDIITAISDAEALIRELRNQVESDSHNSALSPVETTQTDDEVDASIG